jgi:thiamine-phosphate pyrophosphorylase
MDDLRTRLGAARLYLLATSRLCRRPVVETVRRAVAGGVDVVQVREKEIGDREFLFLAGRVGEAAREAGALFIVNDRIEAARDLGADGVHLGQEDRPPVEARRILGPGRLVGLSTHDLAQATAAAELGADYVGVGPVFATQTKETGYAPLGAALAGRIARSVALPAFAIGGVGAESLPALLEGGARRIAVSSAICGAADPEEAARELRRILDATPEASG